MNALMAVKALSGVTYFRPDLIIAVTAVEGTKCSISLMGGVTIFCLESAEEIVARLKALDESGRSETQEETK
jgi:hypothetical protein